MTTRAGTHIAPRAAAHLASSAHEGSRGGHARYSNPASRWSASADELGAPPPDLLVRDTESILRLERIPDSLLILGGGYVGCEFASMFAAFGSRVTLLQGGAQLLPREDPDVAEHVARALADQGVQVRLSARVTAVRRDHGVVVADLEDGGQVRGEELLLATGRTPVTDHLNPGAAGVDLTDQGFVVVDDQLRTTAEGVWAAGDVAGSPQFTHASWHDFRVLRANLTGDLATTSGRLVPYVVFTTLNWRGWA